jgi:hypothetical protein
MALRSHKYSNSDDSAESLRRMLAAVSSRDEPRHIFCARCLCVWEPPVGQLFPDQGAASPGRLLNEPLR